MVEGLNQLVLVDEEMDDEVDREGGLVEQLVFAGMTFGEYIDSCVLRFVRLGMDWGWGWE